MAKWPKVFTSFEPAILIFRQEFLHANPNTCYSSVPWTTSPANKNGQRQGREQGRGWWIAEDKGEGDCLPWSFPFEWHWPLREIQFSERHMDWIWVIKLKGDLKQQGSGIWVIIWVIMIERDGKKEESDIVAHLQHSQRFRTGCGIARHRCTSQRMVLTD